MPIKIIENQNSTSVIHQTSVSTYVGTIETNGEQVLSINLSTARQGTGRDYATEIYYTGPTIP